jgi:hypothetical protein
MSSPADNLNELVALFQSIGPTADETNVRISWLGSVVQELEDTLIMVGNNITDQIRISGMGGRNIGGATESEQQYQSAVLENLNNWLSTISVLTVEAMTRAQDNADVITSAISSIEPGGNNQRNDNGGAGGRPEAGSFKSIVAGFQGGLLTATSAVTKEFLKFRQNLSIAMGSGGLGSVVATASLFASIVTAMPAAFGELSKYAAQFVAALDPGLMAKLSLIVSDLMAVIGKGLRPIIVMTTAVLRLFADILNPIMESMSVAMTSLSDGIMKIAVPFILAWAYAIREMIPIIEGMARVADENSIVFAFLAGTIQVIVGVIASVFNLFLAGLQVITAAVKGTAYALLFVPQAIEAIKDYIPGVGANLDVVKASQDQQESLKNSAAEDMKGAMDSVKAAFNVGDPLTKKPSSGTAAKQAQFTGIADLGKNMMQAAFSSSTQDIANKQLNAAEKSNKWLEQIARFVGFQAKAPDRKAAGVRG